MSNLIKILFIIFIVSTIVMVAASIVGIVMRFNTVQVKLTAAGGVPAEPGGEASAVKAPEKTVPLEKLISSEETSYDEKTGRRKRSVRTDKNKEGSVIRTAEQVYDEKGRVATSKRTNIGEDGRPSTINDYTYIYDPRTGAKIGYSRVDKDAAGKILNNFEYAYDEAGRVNDYVRVLRDERGDISAISEYIYSYDDRTGRKLRCVRLTKDAEGNVHKEETLDFDPATREKISFVRKELDLMGGVLKEESVVYDRATGKKKKQSVVVKDPSGRAVQTYDYSFDADENLVFYVKTARDEKGAVSKVSDYKFEYFPGTGEKAGLVVTERDGRGRLIAEEVHGYDAATGNRNSLMKKEYNQKGIAVKEEVGSFDGRTGGRISYDVVYRNDKGEVVKEYDYEYDDAERVKRLARTSRKGGKILSSREFEYGYYEDGARKKVVEKEKNKTGALLREDVYFYDARGGKERYVRTDLSASGAVSRRFEYVYDAAGRVIVYKKAEMAKDGSVESFDEHVYEYDASTGKKTRSFQTEKTSAAGPIKEKEYRFEPISGRKTSCVKREKTQNGEVLREYLYEYDDKGRISSFVQTDLTLEAAGSSTIKHKYEYSGVSGGKTRYVRRDFNLEGVLMREEICSFDPVTQKKTGYERMERETADGPIGRYECRYDPEGRPLSTVEKSYDAEGGTLSVRKCVYVYDPRTGRKVSSSEISQDRSGRTLGEGINLFDPATGVKTQETRRAYDELGCVAREDVWRYDASSGVKTVYVRTETSAAGSRVEEYFYDEKARTTKANILGKDASGKAVGEAVCTYEYDGRTGVMTLSARKEKDLVDRTARLEIRKFDPKSGLILSSAVETRDKNNRVIYSESSVFDPETGQKKGYSREERDERGNLKSIDKFAYDEKGRILEHTKTAKGKDGSSEIQENKYGYDGEGRRIALSRGIKNMSGKLLKEESYTFDPGTGVKTGFKSVDKSSAGGVTREDVYVYDPVTGRNRKYVRTDTHHSGTILKNISYVYSKETGRKLKYTRTERDESGKLLKNHEYSYDYDPVTSVETGYTRVDKDERGNVVNYVIYSFDEEAKAIFINSAPLAITNKPHYTLEYTAGGKSKKAEFDLAEGVNDLAVRETDSAGKEHVYNFQITLDTTPPLIDAYPAGIAKNADYRLSYLVDGVLKTRSFVLEEGVNELKLQETDQAGNESTYLFAVLLDTTPPVILVEPPKAVNSPLFDLVYTVDGAEKTREFKLKEGVNDIVVKESDDAGNEAVVHFSVELDSKPPVILAAPVKVVNDAVYALNYTVDGDKKTRFYLLEEGNNHIEIKETDEAGNEGAFVFDVVLDSVPPLIKANPPLITNEPKYVLDYEVDGVRKTKTFALDEGENELRIEETDEAGNESAYSFMITLDTEPPRGSFVLTGGEGRAEGKVRFGFSVGDEASGVKDWRIRLDEGPWSEWKEYPPAQEEKMLDIGLEEGQHTLYAEVRDNSGNAAEFSESFFVGGQSAFGVSLIKVKGDRFCEGDIYFVKAETSDIEDLIEMAPRGGSGKYDAEFKLTNTRTGESRVVRMEYPIKGTGNIAYEILGSGGVKRTALDADEVILKGRFYDKVLDRYSPWSDEIVFSLDEHGPDAAVSAAMKDWRVILEMNAMDEGSGAGLWRYNLDGGEWSEWRKYPPLEGDKTIKVGEKRTVKTVFAEFSDNIGNIESFSAPVRSE